MWDLGLNCLLKVQVTVVVQNTRLFFNIKFLYINGFIS